MSKSAIYKQIPVVRATGTGSTTLAAFHDALVQIDAGYYNLLRLSSVIPPRTRVDASMATPVPTGQWGDKLYCVYAEQRTETLGEHAWAGIGWVQRTDGGGGLFVEHEGASEAYVRNAITLSLTDLVAGREKEFSAPEWVLNGAVCDGRPTCSLVLAAYETSPWAGA
jgi:arginine decarboxylase